MQSFYFVLLFLLQFLKPLQLEKLAVWKLPRDNLPSNAKKVFILAIIPNSQNEQDLELNQLDEFNSPPNQFDEFNSPLNQLDELNPPPNLSDELNSGPNLFDERNSQSNLPYLPNSNLFENVRQDNPSNEDSAEIGGINYYHFSKKHQKRGHKKTKCDVRTDYGTDKIVGGVEVDINLYPYHVAYGSNCGGAIIDKKWIMTAGHCGEKPYIRVGSKYFNQGRKYEVKRSHIHPKWLAKIKEHPFDYDYQLLELAEPLKFDDNVQKIKIGHIEDMEAGKVMTVTGWGHTLENGAYSSVLRAVRVPIIPKVHCQSVPFPYFRGSLTPRMFCAGYSEGKKDACQGDSGGPAVVEDRLLGVISFGYGCATPGSYGVYSKVASVRDWIEETTRMKFV